jgi:hypothetical protein
MEIVVDTRRNFERHGWHGDKAQVGTGSDHCSCSCCSWTPFSFHLSIYLSLSLYLAARSRFITPFSPFPTPVGGKRENTPGKGPF